MHEIRKDPVVNRWVIFADGRGLRPSDWSGDPPQQAERPLCPFCPGHETHTPPELLAFRDASSTPNGPGWSLRVVPNKFPALRVEGALESGRDGNYERLSGVGAHEVIIESPEHDAELSELEAPQIARVLSAFRDRMLDLEGDLRLRYVLVFKNQGVRAGATLTHGHSQLIATPIVPPVVQAELDASLERFTNSGRCVFCELLEQELRDRRRIICEREGFVSLAPYASRFPFEAWVLPRRHAASFAEIEPADLPALAAILKETLGRIRRALNRPHYNFAIHTAPCRERPLDHYHWHIEITPKRTPAAGFEWGSGFHINSVSPEEAAEYLRAIEL